MQPQIHTIKSLVKAGQAAANPKKGAGKQYVLYSEGRFVGLIVADTRRRAITFGNEVYHTNLGINKALPFVGSSVANEMRSMAGIEKIAVRISDQVLTVRFPKQAKREDKCVVDLHIPFQEPDKWSINVERTIHEYVDFSAIDWADNPQVVEKEMAKRAYLQYANVQEAFRFLGLLIKWVEQA